MRRNFVIGSIGALVLLGIIVGLFIMRGNPTDAARGRSATPTPTTVRATPTPITIRARPTPTTVRATPTTVRATPTPITIKTTPTPGSSGNSETQLTQQLFQQINSDRAAQGLPAYTWDDKIAVVSRQHSVTMGQGCGLSHQCAGEPDPCQRLTNAGITWMACGENAGYTSPTPNAWSAVKTNIEQGMLNERPPDDGHRRNLLSTSFHRVGIGIYTDSKGIIWVTEDFTN